MKIVLLCFILMSLPAGLAAQVPFAKTEWCKTNEIQVITGDVFPENHVVIGVGSFLKVTGIETIEQLSAKILQKMKKLAVAHHCCKVFVDFKNKVSNSTDKDGNSLNETQVSYYTIRPLYYLMNK